MTSKIIKIESKWFWGSSVYLVTADGNALVKCVIDDNDKDTCELQDLNVHSDYRTRGFAKALMQEAEQVAKEHGCQFMLLWAEKDKWMRKWYERLGYYEEEFINPVHESTMWMRKNLKPVKYGKR